MSARSVGVGMQKDGIVLEALRRLDENIGHVRPVKLTLFLLHLIPLVVAAMGGMNLTKGFHREEENQLEVRHTSDDGAAFERGNKALSGGHDGTATINWSGPDC